MICINGGLSCGRDIWPPVELDIYVGENKEIPDGSMVLGSPGRVMKQLDPEQQADLKKIAVHYVENHQRYKRDLRPMD